MTYLKGKRSTYINNHNTDSIVVSDANMIPLWSLTEWINEMIDLLRSNVKKEENVEQEQPGNLTINKLDEKQTEATLEWFLQVITEI